MPLVVVLIITAVLFLIILSTLGFQPKLLSRLLGRIICVTGIAGILLYGYGYYVIYGPTPTAVTRALFSVFCMFLGRNEISAISGVPLLSTEPMQVLLYLVHLMALYATASSVVAGIGTRLIRILSLWSVHHKDLRLIYGVSEDSVRFGERLLGSGKGVIIFVDSGTGTDYSAKILQMGSVMLNDDTAVTPKKGLLKKIGFGPGSQKLSVYCLDSNTTNNLRYAEQLMELFRESGIAPQQTAVTLLVPDGSAGEALQASVRPDAEGKTKYGYGSVYAIEREDLIARLLVRRYPPYTTMRFREKAVADENFEAVIVGFGKTGQAVLRALLMNGQFVGSRFHATIIADQYSRSAGSFFYAYPEIREKYLIDILELNARSVAFYQRLVEIGSALNYVAVCTGSEQENNEVAAEIRDFLRARGSRACVVQCSGRGVNRISDRDGLPQTEELYTPEILCGDSLDAMAKILNHQYHLGENNDAETDWAGCDYFSRQSCRASADFVDAMVSISGCSREKIRTEGWPDDPQLLENLAVTEHLRWCAFHYAAGYRGMEDAEFAARGEAWQKEMRETGSCRFRIGKDPEKRRHACLVPWEELDALSEKEEVYTGIHKDYKQMDRDNVQMIPEMLRQEPEKRS